MRAEGRTIPCNVERVLGSERRCWYECAPGTRSGRRYFDLASGECEYRDEEVPAGVSSVTVMKKSNGEVKRNAGASLIDLGDGVGCIEFHSKMNAIGPDIGQLISQTLGFAPGFDLSMGAAAAKPDGPGGNFEAFVITNDAANFSVGANLMLVLMAVQEQEWDEIDQMVRAFQSMTQAIKFSPKPVVIAPFNLALGGGCEIALARPGSPGPCRTLYGTGGKRGRPAARRRRLQRDVVAGARRGLYGSPRRAGRLGRGGRGHQAHL